MVLKDDRFWTRYPILLIPVVIIMLYFCKNKGIYTGKQRIQEWPHYHKLFFPGSENGRCIDNKLRRQTHNNTSSEYSLDQALDLLLEEYSFCIWHLLFENTQGFSRHYGLGKVFLQLNCGHDVKNFFCLSLM